MRPTAGGDGSPGGGGTPLPTFIYLFIMNDRILELYCSVDEPQHVAAFTVSFLTITLPSNRQVIGEDNSQFFFGCQSINQSIKFIISVAHCRLDFTIKSSIQI